MSKDYVGDLMNLLQRDTINGKFGCYEDDDYNIIDDDYDDDDYEDDDEIIVIDDDYDDDDCDDDQIVVDNEYVPDKFEEDLFDKKYSRNKSDDDDDDISIFDLYDDKPDEVFSFDSILNNKEPIKNKNKKENEIVDDKIAKTLAKDITNAEVQLTKSESDDDSWLNEDMFGNDIGKIIVEEEPKEKETYSTGEFSEWASKSKKSK